MYQQDLYNTGKNFMYRLPNAYPYIITYVSSQLLLKDKKFRWYLKTIKIHENFSPQKCKASYMVCDVDQAWAIQHYHITVEYDYQYCAHCKFPSW